MKNKKINALTVKDTFLVLLPVIAVFCIWQYASNNNLVNASILPSPQKVWAALCKLIANHALWKHIVSSLVRVLKGYVIGALAGALIGTFAALSRTVGKLITAPAGILRPIPAIALIPFFILWMGIGEQSKVAVIVFGSFWPVLLNTMEGIKSTDSKLIEVGEILEKDKWIVISKIILPSALPSIFTGLRLGISSAWTCVVAAEMIAASSGIGFLISYSREMAQPASLFVGVVTIGVFGVLIDAIFLKLYRILIYWKKAEENH